MKKILLSTMVLTASYSLFGQAQIGNSDFEQWEPVVSGEEPVNWNSFLSGTGSLSSFAGDQCESSTDVRPGSPGTKSCRIFSREVFTIIANGNVTLGRINMGSTQPSAPENYNFSNTADPNFSEALTDNPDSIVFWAKFVPFNGSGNARMKSTLHTNYNYRDPEDAASSAEVVGTAVLNFPNTNNGWTRFAVPFVYAGPASAANQAFILTTFTTNEQAGGGSADDQLWIDDIELIYNPSGLDEVGTAAMQVAMNNTNNTITVLSKENLNGSYEVLNLMGQRVQVGELSKEIAFNQPAGMYIVQITQNGLTQSFEIVRL